MNPFDGLAKFCLGVLEQRKIQDWLKFLFELVFSTVVTFMYAFSASIGTCAAVLISGKAPSLTPGWTLVIALGAGTGWASVSATRKFRQASDKLTKGMSVVLPSAEATQEIQSDIQVITKN